MWATRHCPNTPLPPGNPNLFVCNNDATIKVFEVQPQQLRQAFLIRCSMAINYVSTSATDPANIVAVGDSKDVYLYRAVCLWVDDLMFLPSCLTILFDHLV